jgi:hypothetical protein
MIFVRYRHADESCRYESGSGGKNSDASVNELVKRTVS